MNKPEWCATMYRKDGSKYVFCKEALEKTMVTPKQRAESERRKQEIKERTVKEYKDFVNKTLEEEKQKPITDLNAKNAVINKNKLITAIDEIQDLIPSGEDNVSVKWNSGRGGWKQFRRKRKELRTEQLEDIDRYMLFNIMKLYVDKYYKNEKYKKQLEKIVGDTQR